MKDLPRLVVPLEPSEHARVKDFFARTRRIMTVEVRRMVIAYVKSEKVRAAVDEVMDKKKP